MWVHRLTNINPEEKMADCAHCGPVKIRTRGKKPNGTPAWHCTTDDKVRYRTELRRKTRNRTRELRRCRRGGVPVELSIDHVGEWYKVKLEEQNGACAICGQLPDKRALALDHDHVTGKLRGLLCSGCNLTVGRIEKEPEMVRRAIKYLQKYQ